MYAVFTEPGDFSFDLGLSLTVYDICDDSEFPSAPVLVPDMENYYYNQGNLVVATTWAEDTVSRDTENVCGDYSIVAVLNSGLTQITTGTIDGALTKITSTDATQFIFTSA